MSFGTITSTESTFGSISGSIVGAVPGTLSGSVGVPGPAGAGVPAGGTAGQYLQKTTTGVDYATDWVTLNLSGYAPLASPAFTGNPTAPTAALGDNDTSLATTAFVQQELLSGTANAKNLEVYVRNQTGSTLSAGAIVYINGATGNRPTVTLAQANNDANSAQTMGFVKTAIANNGFGYVIVRGEIEGLDTQAVAEGTQLYLSPTVAGAYTTTKPSAPQHLVYVGIVIRSHPTQGVILVAVQNGYELNELHDVSITSPTNGQVLKYNSTTGLWYNGTDSAGVAWGGITGTLSNQTDLQTALDGKYSTTNPAGYITSSALTGYATESWVTSQGYETAANAAATYYPLTNPAGYLTSSALAGYATESWVTSQGYLTSAPVTSVAGRTGAITLSNTDISGLGTMATATAADYSTTTVADGLYYPLSSNPAGYLTSASLTGYATESWVTAGFYPLTGNPSSFLVAADIAGKANTASPALTGNVTITTNSTSPALVITQDGTGDVIQFKDVTSDTTYSFIDQNGKVNTVASSTTSAGFNVPHGTAPTSPVNGDVWTTTGNLWVRISGVSQAIALQGNSAQLSSNNTFTNASSTYGNSTAAGTINLGTGATISGATKAINIGTGGVAGSTTNITIGSNSGGTSTTTLQGTTNGVTVAADTNSTAVATTAFVVGQAGSATPLVNGTAAVGTSLRYARQDHVHPTDTSRAALASPTFTGTPAAPTASPGTNTTQIATTAFVQQEVPAASTTAAGKVELATRVEAIEATTNTVAVTPLQAVDMLMHPGYVQIAQNNGNVVTATSGAGAGIFTTSMTRVCLGPNASTAGYVTYRPQTNGGVAQMWSRGNSGAQINFSKKVWMSGRSCYDNSFIGDANNISRVTIGKAAVTAGALAQKGIGWEKAGGSTANFFLLAHNGTTLTSVNTNTSLSSLGLSGGSMFDWSIYSDGAGNVTMWINDTQVATTSAGPTGLSIASCVWQEEIDQTASAATRMYFTVYGGHYYHV